MSFNPSIPPSGSGPAREPLNRDGANVRRAAGVDPMYYVQPTQHKAAAMGTRLTTIPSGDNIPQSLGFVNPPDRPIPLTVSAPSAYNQTPVKPAPVREALNKGAAVDPLRQASGALQGAGVQVVAVQQLTAKPMPQVYSKPAASGGLDPNRVQHH